ncbi:hypothetical protein GCM10027614_36830 [Micromonospora vulcania]
MSLLPSPIPHPLDYAPWDVPGWIYDALDWVVGVQWPEGNERAVWDLADQWYAVAAVLAGPHTDAATAAAEVRSGYGGVGAVGEAFEAAWRAIAEAEDAPLPVLLAVTADLGRLVEECGCDIEGAKIEVWLELGILVIELLTLAVVAVLTAVPPPGRRRGDHRHPDGDPADLQAADGSAGQQVPAAWAQGGRRAGGQAGRQGRRTRALPPGGTRPCFVGR